jgi:steroid 5-alpha reductase family enzyme
MSRENRNALVSVVVVILVGAGLALADSQGGASVLGIPLLAFSVGLAFLIQWLVFIPAYILQSEEFFDLTGSITYISVTILAVLLGPVVDGRSILLTALVLVWAGRLGTFLFRRVRKAGKDARFDELKPSFLRFLSAWTIQGLWVSFTLAAALAAITATTRKPLGVFALIG